jgi:hypothetical protein
MTSEILSLCREMVECLELHPDYDIEDGFTENEFVDWVMEGIGDDMVREGHSRDIVAFAAREAFTRVSPRFRR